MNVCYLSSTELGKEMYSYLKNLNCNIAYADTENSHTMDFQNIDYDLGISFLYTYKIPASEFSKSKMWLNFHPGPLPEYRGRNLCYHAIMNSADRFGATLHYMDKDFDTGNIIEVITFPIESHYTAGDLSKISKNALVTLFKKYIPRFLSGEIVKGIMQKSNGNYYKKTFIKEKIILSFENQLKVKAITVAPDFYAHTIIGGKKYYIIPEKDINHSN